MHSRKTTRNVFIFIGLLVLVALAWFLYAQHAAPTSQSGQPLLPVTPITIPTTSGSSTIIEAELATTETEREAGLSARATLPKNGGMLFVFDQSGQYGFWMKDMRFPLDIIWAAADGTITTIAAGLSPATYPKVFYPSALSKYVLEVPAGFAAAHGVTLGSKIVL